MIILDVTEISGLKQPTYNSGATNKIYVDLISGNLNTKIVGAACTWTVSGDDIYRNGKVIVGHSGFDLGDYNFQVSGSSYFSGTVVFKGATFSGLSDPTFPSGVANKHYVDTISSNTVGKYYPSTLGKSKFIELFNASSTNLLRYNQYVGHSSNTLIHFTKASIDDDYTGSSQAIRKYFPSSVGHDIYTWYNASGIKLYTISTNLNTKINQRPLGSTISSNFFKITSGNTLWSWYSNSSSKLSALSGSLSNRINTKINGVTVSSNFFTRVSGNNLWSFSSNSKYLFPKSSNVNKNYLDNVSSNAKKAKASGARVADLFNHELYTPSSIQLFKYYPSTTGKNKFLELFNTSSTNKTRYNEYVGHSGNKFPHISIAFSTNVYSSYKHSANSALHTFNAINYITSANALSKFTNSTSALSKYAPSKCTRYGWTSVADAGTIAHNCSSKPNWVTISPSGASPIMYSFIVDTTNITVYHSDAGSRCFSWRAII